MGSCVSDTGSIIEEKKNDKDVLPQTEIQPEALLKEQTIAQAIDEFNKCIIMAGSTNTLIEKMQLFKGLLNNLENDRLGTCLKSSFVMVFNAVKEELEKNRSVSKIDGLSSIDQFKSSAKYEETFLDANNYQQGLGEEDSVQINVSIDVAGFRPTRQNMKDHTGFDNLNSFSGGKDGSS
jgi:hypothetical protein